MSDSSSDNNLDEDEFQDAQFFKELHASAQADLQNSFKHRFGHLVFEDSAGSQTLDERAECSEIFDWVSNLENSLRQSLKMAQLF